MKRISIYSIILFLGAMMVFNACKKDDFNEEDAINLINDRDVKDAMIADSINTSVFFSVKVVDASADYFNKSAKNLTNVIVSVSNDGKIYTDTTDINGFASFKDLTTGTYSVTVRAEGYTTVDFVAATKDKGYYSVQIPVLSTTTNTMTVAGKVVIEKNVTTKAKEDADGVNVVFTPNFSEFSVANTQGIGSIAYSGFVNKIVTGADGKYTLTLPADAKGELFYEATIPTFEATQTILMSTINNVDVTGAGFTAQTLPALFGTAAPTASDVSTTVSPVYAVFSTPNNITPAVLSVSLFNKKGVESVNITEFGAKYTGSPNMKIKVDNANDVSADDAYINPVIDATTGEIKSFSVSASGKNFANAPVINLNPDRLQPLDITIGTVSGTGSITSIPVVKGGLYLTKNIKITVNGSGVGASLEPVFVESADPNGEEIGWKIASINIINGGTNYTAGSTISITLQSGVTTAKALPNMTTGEVHNVIVKETGANYPKNKTDIKVKFSHGNAAATASTDANGRVFAVAVTDGGSSYTDVPTAVIETVNKTAKGKVTVSSTTGEITGMTIDEAGSGYTSPTVAFYNQVTGEQITDVKSVIVLTGSTIGSVSITSPGALKFNFNVAKRDQAAKAEIKALPGTSTIQNFDLGTGFRSLNN